MSKRGEIKHVKKVPPRAWKPPLSQGTPRGLPVEWSTAKKPARASRGFWKNEPDAANWDFRDRLLSDFTGPR